MDVAEAISIVNATPICSESGEDYYVILQVSGGQPSVDAAADYIITSSVGGVVAVETASNTFSVGSFPTTGAWDITVGDGVCANAATNGTSPSCCPACLAGAEFADTTYACDGLSRLDLDAYADLTLVNEYPANAVLNWTFVVNSGAPIVDMTDLTSVNITHSGVGCDAENVTFTLTIDCVSDPNLDLIAGTHTVYVYPTLDATDIVDGSTTCSAEVTPVVACADLLVLLTMLMV
ncbi:MAG: hypothetical protein H6554_03960 [Chitinophagales bacterium]|nr:hypothetical protein [Chitinophagales bacterium]